MKWLFYTNINKKKHKIVKTKSLFVIKKNNDKYCDESNRFSCLFDQSELGLPAGQ